MFFSKNRHVVSYTIFNPVQFCVRFESPAAPKTRILGFKSSFKAKFYPSED